jgi:hypothetical protein
MCIAGGEVAGGDSADSTGTAGQGPARFTGEHTSHCRYLPAGSVLAAYIFARPFTVSPAAAGRGQELPGVRVCSKEQHLHPRGTRCCHSRQR